ncbi:MAG TPA: tryptophan-rich sensory protein [Clostridia bacterium]|nr:MAG: TspO/MBR family protein [Firmicutes bacterium ADurb.Bin146]HOD93542.1 tryptophan-rich sensory protein [Clostridia bacterium]HQM39861.1 tryptophan-rich sensory protein [Clostridia bacterium]
MNQWYMQLKKPLWSPPSKIFGPVWSILYLGIIVSFGYSAYMLMRSQISWIVFLPFILNIVFNILFTPLQFRLRSNILALLDILLVLSTLIWLMLTIFPYKPWIAYINIPYLLWVSFATILQASITWLNRKIKR